MVCHMKALESTISSSWWVQFCVGRCWRNITISWKSSFCSSSDHCIHTYIYINRTLILVVTNNRMCLIGLTRKRLGFLWIWFPVVVSGLQEKLSNCANNMLALWKLLPRKTSAISRQERWKLWNNRSDPSDALDKKLKNDWFDEMFYYFFGFSMESNSPGNE